MNFEEFLQRQNLADSTIKGHQENLKRFIKWCEKGNINYKTAEYNQLLKFIDQFRKREKTGATINIHLNSIGKYYNYLIHTKQRKHNPIKELRVKQDGKKVLQNILTQDQLEKIYNDYANKPLWSFREERQKQIHQRNNVIVGLLIYQGLQTCELKRLEKSHINLAQGNIYIPSTRRSNSRILKLQTVQIIPMQQYFFSFIPAEEQSRHGRGEKLFTGNLHSITGWLMQELRRINREIKSASQIRSSVIVGWLRQHNIRQVQYMAGHRHIGSTERYRQDDLEDLQRQLELFHPLGQSY